MKRFIRVWFIEHGFCFSKTSKQLWKRKSK